MASGLPEIKATAKTLWARLEVFVLSFEGK